MENKNKTKSSRKLKNNEVYHEVWTMKDLKVIPILRWKNKMIMMIIMTIITFTITIIITPPHPQNNKQQKQDSRELP